MIGIEVFELEIIDLEIIWVEIICWLDMISYKKKYTNILALEKYCF